MTEAWIKRLKEEMERQRFNYKSLSLAAGLGDTTVRDIIIGRARNPRRDTLQKIATVLGVPVMYFMTDEAVSAPLPLPGGKSSGRNRVLRESSVNEVKYDALPGLPESGNHKLAILRIETSALQPFLPPGTLLYYGEPLENAFNTLLGKLCVAQVKNAPVAAGVLQTGSLYGHYHFTNYRTVIEEDMAMQWCAAVRFIEQP